jgi:hypothetical protein
MGFMVGGEGIPLRGGADPDLCSGGSPRADEFPRGDLGDRTCEELREAAER